MCRWPLMAAWTRAQHWFLSWWFTRAPFSTRRREESRQPSLAAQMRAVQPWLFVLSTSAPNSSSRDIISPKPWRANTQRRGSPVSHKIESGEAPESKRSLETLTLGLQRFFWHTRAEDTSSEQKATQDDWRSLAATMLEELR